MADLPANIVERPAVNAAALRQMNQRMNMINRIVDLAIRLSYDSVLAAARAGRNSWRWDEYLLVTDIDLTNQERHDVKYRLKLGLIEKFPDVRVNTDQPLSFIELTW